MFSITGGSHFTRKLCALPISLDIMAEELSAEDALPASHTINDSNHSSNQRSIEISNHNHGCIISRVDNNGSDDDGYDDDDLHSLFDQEVGVGTIGDE